jgi:NADH-quinone oxidoreductase subunit M
MLGLAAAMALTTAGGSSPEMIDAARATAVNAAVLQMFNHGIITGALFLLVGLIYDQRTHVRDFRKLGPGLWRTVPRYGTFLLVAAFASLGLPGLAGFVSEFFVFRGAFGVGLAGNTPLLVLSALSVLGIVITAAFILWKVIQVMLLGPQNETWSDVPDLTNREMGMLAPLTAIMVLFGVYPKPILDLIDSATTSLMPTLGTLTEQAAASLPHVHALFRF